MRLALKPLSFLLAAVVCATGCTRSTNPASATMQPEAVDTIEPQIAGAIRPQRGEPTRAMLLVCSPEREVRFGVVAQGGRKEGVFQLTNPTDAAIEVTEIKISCECLKITLPLQTIEAGELMSGIISLDLAVEPESTGNLRIEVEGFTDEGKTAFAFSVSVDIRGSQHPAGDQDVQ